MPHLTQDLVVLPADSGRWVLYNPLARSALGVLADAIEFLGNLDGLKEPGRSFPVWEIQEMSNYHGLYADPSGFVRDVGEWPDAEELSGAELLDRLRERFIVIDDESAYRDRFSDKTSLLDTQNFGNFHQALGQELLVNRRVSPDEWWVNQKFTPDRSDTNPNLYSAVQKYGLRRYIASRFQPGHSVLDIGCGTGFFTKSMAETGADVIGVDPNEEFIQLAMNSNPPANCRYEVVDVGSPNSLDDVPSASMDFVFMSDVLLFYFVPVDPNSSSDISVLLSDIKRVLKPGGRLVSLEPNHAFWLKPWLGDVDHPFTIVTEHAQRTYGVGPTLGELMGTMTASGFMLSKLEEMDPDPEFESVDPRAYHFARQFPVWQLFEFALA
jgi:SAM-dependent methyltransferase